jgi:hypothetical protein
MLPGIQGLNDSLLTATEQNLAICVIKVSEEVARIYNPTSGVASSSRYVYVGYDAWSVILTTANPIGPMAAQTYITPQSVTGSITNDNHQVIVPPNFPTAIYYKNVKRNVPNTTFAGTFAGSSFN